jgi:cation diffusion facilitator CzcD-associated flavoprotein CzcO
MNRHGNNVGESATGSGKSQMIPHFDLLIIGGGLSGIAAACHLKRLCPKKTYAILEARDSVGGTWDLFRYPGIRSDSDIYTFGYSFRPWLGEQSMVDGPSILRYIHETVEEYGLESKIRFRHQVLRAAWNTSESRWILDVEITEEKTIVQYSCNFLFVASGYYDYAEGYAPIWPGMESFCGRIVHPQHWPQDLIYEKCRIAIIGSGATAVTLAPAMAEKAAHVTIVQRSPTYIVARPGKDVIARWLQKLLPARAAHSVMRAKNVLVDMYFYNLARKRPKLVKQKIVEMVQEQLGKEYDVGKHFTPGYKPWDQRLCLIPDADLFKAIRSGKVTVVTGEIESFSETGLKLRSGEHVEADIIVTATGLKLKLMGGIEIIIDGALVDLAKTFVYKGMMCSDVPNFAFAFGYTNASWTLKCELTAKYVCRLLRHMDAFSYNYCVARRRDSKISEQPAVDLNSGYVKRSIAQFPKQGSKRPWRLYQNYLLDTVALKFGQIADAEMEFGKKSSFTARVDHV